MGKILEPSLPTGPFTCAKEPKIQRKPRDLDPCTAAIPLNILYKLTEILKKKMNKKTFLFGCIS